MSQTKAQLIDNLVQALNFTGTASAPANGLFLSAANTLKLATASTERLKIDGTEVVVNDTGVDVDFRVEGDTEANLLFVDAGEDKVGIGTGTPSGARLHIVGSGNTGLKVQVGSSSADQIYLGNTGGASSVGTLTNVGFNLIQNGGVALAVDTNKKVGIGTTSPDANLSVASDTAFIDIGTAGGNRGKIGYTSNDLYIGTTSSSGELFFKNNINSTDNPESSGSTLMTIDSSGRVLIGTTSSRASAGIQTKLQIEGTDEPTSSLSLIRNTDNTNAPRLIFGKTRGGSVGSNTVVQDDDVLGNISFLGNDGTDLGSFAANIAAFVDGTPGSNDMPGRLVFSTTPDGSDATTPRMTILSSGNVGIGTTSPTYATEIKASSTDAYDVDNIANSQHQLRILNAGLGGTAGLLFTAEPSSGSAGHAGIRVISPSSGKADMTFSVRDSGTYSEKFRILNDGKVGINDSSPSKTLDITGEGGGNGEINVKRTSGATCFIQAQSATAVFGSSSNHNMQLKSNGTTALTIDTSQRVGIGTSSPSSLLHLARSSTTAYDTSSTTGDTSFLIQNTGAAGHSTIQLDVKSGGTANVGQATISALPEADSSKSTSLSFGTRDSSGNQAAERMRINSDGDVSISGNGTVHGASKLTVLPANRTTAFAASDGDTWHDIVLKQTGDATANSVGIAFVVGSSAYHKNAGTGICAVKNGTASDYGSDLVFITRPQSAAAEERLRILSDGKVGIGTTSPSANLESQGNVSSTTQFSGFQGLRIQNANGSTHGITADINMVVGTSTNNRGAVIGVEYTSTSSGNDLYFATNPGAVTNSDAVEERLRITSAGDVLVGTQSSSIAVATNDVTGVNLSPAGRIFLKTNDHCDFNIVGGGEIIRFRFGNTSGTTQSHAGDIDVTGTNTVVYGSTSDYRLKENAVSISDGISRLKTLKPYRFNFKSEPSKTLDGFFAHEAQEVVPEAVVGIKDDPDRMQGIDQAKLVPLLTAALQEAISKIETLETKVAALEAA